MRSDFIKIICPAFLIVLLATQMNYAEEGQAGTESNIKMGFGARALGLGQAFTAMADDPTAVFWNPSGLEFVHQQSVTFFHTTLFEGTMYDFLGYAYPTLNLGTFGIGVGRIGTGNVTQRDILGNDLGNFTFEEYHGFFSYAKKLPWDFTGGLSVRVIRRGWNSLQEEGDLVDTGVGLDFGMMYKPQIFTSVLLRDWSFGLSLRNLFAPQVNEGEAIDEFPLTVRLGILRKLYLMGEGNRLNFLMDFDYSEKRDLLLHFGLEYRFREMGMLRAGFDGKGLTFGAGTQYSIFQIDYAFGSSPYADVFSSVHRFSLSVNFGRNRDEMFEIVAAEQKAEEERIIAEIREADRQRYIAEHLKQGEEYFEEERYLDAMVEYRQVLLQDAYNNRARVMIDSSEALLQKEFDERQSSAVQQALDKDRAESDRAFVTEHFEKGRNYLQNNQFTEALIEFNIALERDPDNETIINAINTTERRISEETSRLIQQGRREFQAGNYSEALRLLGDARILGGDDAEIQREIATLAERIRLTENIQRGLELFDIGEFQQALSIFEEALNVDPDNELVRQYYERAKIETAGDQEKMSPEAEKRYLQGVDKFLLGKYGEAIEIWEKILQDYPYNKKVLTAIRGARERLKGQK